MGRFVTHSLEVSGSATPELGWAVYQVTRCLGFEIRSRRMSKTFGWNYQAVEFLENIKEAE